MLRFNVQFSMLNVNVNDNDVVLKLTRHDTTRHETTPHHTPVIILQTKIKNVSNEKSNLCTTIPPSRPFPNGTSHI